MTARDAELIVAVMANCTKIHSFYREKSAIVQERARRPIFLAVKVLSETHTENSPKNVFRMSR